MAVNAVKILAQQTAAVFTDPVITPGVTIAKAVHHQELRTAVTEARQVLGLTQPNFTTLSAGVTRISASHVMELREAVK
jgi:hypothetical protein